jgi:hypothetical protein
VLSEFQRILALALHDAAPRERLRELAQDAALTSDERGLLEAIDDDALKLTSLVVRKLRFERVLRGSPEVREELERDPDRVRGELRAYVREVPPRFGFPDDEARAFEVHRRR